MNAQHGRSGPMEPTADMRELANICHQMYVALVAEGFTSSEALEIIGHQIRGSR